MAMASETAGLQHAHDSVVGRICNPSYADQRDGLEIRPTAELLTVIKIAFASIAIIRPNSRLGVSLCELCALVVESLTPHHSRPNASH